MLQSTQDSLQLYTNISVNPDALAEACGRDETATVGEFHRNKKKKTTTQKNDKHSQGGERETTTERTQQIYAYT